MSNEEDAMDEDDDDDDDFSNDDDSIAENVDQNEEIEGVNVRRQRKNVERRADRNNGKAYMTRKGKDISEKQYRYVECKCKNACKGNEITDEMRQQIHNEFWALGDWNTQTQYIVQSVMVAGIRRRVDGGGMRKNESRYPYLLQKRVCKNVFLTTLGVSNKRYNYALKVKRSETGIAQNDKRGQKIPPNKTPQDDTDFIKQHIRSFPTFKSHYSNSDRQYLSPDLSVTKMFDLYKEECQVENRRACSSWVYRRVFHTDFNLHFYVPRTDTCKHCDKYRVKIEALDDGAEKEAVRAEWADHMERATKAKANLKAVEEGNAHSIIGFDDGEKNSVIGLTFDLEKTLPTPHLNTNEVYYMRQLWTYNLGIHHYPKDRAVMNMWHEGMAGRGSTEIASCLYDFYQSLPDEIEHVVTLSDGCGGQNRNFPMARFHTYIVNHVPHIHSVNMMFMETGHSYLPNDRDFGLISRAIKKRETVYTPVQYQELVQNCNKKSPFEVNRMTRFISFNALENVLINRKKNEEGNQVRWLKIRWVVFEKGSLKMKYKTSLTEEEFMVVDLCRQKRRPEEALARLQDFVPEEIPIVHNITYKKYCDLQKLLDYIPPIHHEFFEMLPHETSKKSESHSEVHPDIISDDEEY